MHKFVVYKDVPATIEIKMWHVRKIGGTPRRSFIKDVGDVPVMVYNEETKTFVPVDNTRGNGYAGRNRKMYRNKKNKKPRYGKWD